MIKKDLEEKLRESLKRMGLKARKKSGYLEIAKGNWPFKEEILTVLSSSNEEEINLSFHTKIGLLEREIIETLGTNTNIQYFDKDNKKYVYLFPLHYREETTPLKNSELKIGQDLSFSTEYTHKMNLIPIGPPSKTGIIRKIETTIREYAKSNKLSLKEEYDKEKKITIFDVSKSDPKIDLHITVPKYPLDDPNDALFMIDRQTGNLNPDELIKNMERIEEYRKLLQGRTLFSRYKGKYD